MPSDSKRIPIANRDATIALEREEERAFEERAIVQQRCVDGLDEIIRHVLLCAEKRQTLFRFEPQLVRWLFALGKLLYVLYLTRAEEVHSERFPAQTIRDEHRFERRGRQARWLGTFFGKVRYWRTYMGALEGDGAGFFPLDDALGMTADGFTMRMVDLACRLATKMPFDAAAVMLKLFLGWSPAKRTIEHMVLGLGAETLEYVEQAQAPEGDGEVLVIQFDSKGIPTATESELRKRRGRRRPNPHPESKRHRGRAKRRRSGPKRRRCKGDKSKNARMATMVVMYTLKQAIDENGNPKLLGPINLRVFACFAPKKYAFQIARREAIKRGFSADSGKLIQFVNDGDDDLEIYRQRYFGDYDQSQIILTADLPHVLEYLWSAGTAVHDEGTGELAAWVAKQKRRLMDSRADLIRKELEQILGLIPKQGPGNSSRRERLQKAIGYLEANAKRLDYKRVRHMDLELASGAVEGAIKHIIGARFDHGGMRWIRERAEALLQLRCIEINGQWDDFIRWAHDRMQEATCKGRRFRIRRKIPKALPKSDDCYYDKAA